MPFFKSRVSEQVIPGDLNFSFTKINEKGAGLPGALFSLYTSEDFSVGADRLAYSGADGVVAFSKLPAGVYYVQETTVPYSYILDTTVYKVVLTAVGYEIYFGKNYENKLSDYANKIVNKSKYVVVPVSVTLTAAKILTGRSLADRMFSFIVKDAAGKICASGANDMSGKVNFSNIEFDAPGAYAFSVEEVAGGYSGYTYDSSKYTVTVTVTDDGSGKLRAEVTYPGGGIVFKNSYADTPVTPESPCRCRLRNTRCRKTVKAQKIWVDNNNEKGTRPTTVEIILLRDGERFKTAIISSGGSGMFHFDCLPVWKNSGEKFEYTIDEAAVPGYTKSINGFTITNTLIAGGFSFAKTSKATGLSLQGAMFEIRQNGGLIATSASDAAGKVTFSWLTPGSYQMAETIPPVGYMSNPAVYDVEVLPDGSVTVDGMPAAQFTVENTPAEKLLLQRATAVIPAYMAAPNTWPLHGTIEPDLYMLDKIIITLPKPAVTVKWAYGVQDADYFRTGGGIDVTATYQDGIPAPLNTDYTVYVLYGDGTDGVASITIDRLRDGSEEMPYLLIDFSTADALEPEITGIDQFTLYYMQGNGVKLTQHYEIYENIDMEGKTWEPLGPLQTMEKFTGSLYGNGHDITNLTVGDMTTMVGDYYGFFRFVGDGASIQNLSITNGSIGDSYVSAGFAAYVVIEKGGSVLLKDLHFQGATKGESSGGGIAGVVDANNGSFIIDGCTVDANIESIHCTGGIASYCVIGATGSLSVINCSSSGLVTSKFDTSGIIGILVSDGSAEIYNCVSAMEVEGSGSAGGIATYLAGSGSTVISSCYNKGDITGSNCGGIASGNNIDTPLNYKIINCYNSGNINASSFGGGIHGIDYGPSVTQNCYNTGNVYSVNMSAGISVNNGITENCAAVCQTVSGTYQSSRISPLDPDAPSGLSNNVAFDNMQVLINGVQKDPLDIGGSGADGISVTSAEIKTQALYENTLGWDFTNAWVFGNGAYTLPVLRGIPLSLQPDVLPPHLT